MERSYKATRSYEEAVSELRLASGTQLDSTLVDLFCRIPQQQIQQALNDVMKKLERYQEENFRD